MSNLLDNPSFLADLRNVELSGREVADRWPVSKSTVNEYRKNGLPGGAEETPADTTEASTDGTKAVTAVRSRPITLDDARDWITSTGDNPDDYTLSIRSIAYGEGMFSNRMSAVPKHKGAVGGPAWPVIQPAQTVVVEGQRFKPSRPPRDARFQLALKCADTQIGFRILPDGTLDPFHDDTAMALFVQVCAEYQPEKIQILGDFLDLAAQGRFAQEAAFANTTQLAINRGHQFLAELRAACPTAEIILIEGNHDLRMQRFIESNALAAFGLKQANTPESWPVMSLPFLLRLAELNVKYIDAYPAATDWDNDLTRNIHGTRSNSKGSTMSQYVHELPHVSTWAGHTHRAEIVYRTVLGARGEPIESYAANPGVLCRTDGAVPSVHGALGASGIPERIVEDWQQGFGMLYYTETESWPQVYRIKNGRAIIGDRVLSATPVSA